MKTRAQATSIRMWLVAGCLPALILCAASSVAQTPASSSPAIAPSAIHTTIDLNGPWRFQVGDDPRWADPGFDDSKWSAVLLSTPLSDQGIDSYSGYAWYRLRLTREQFAQIGSLPLHLLVAPNSVGQLSIYLNGTESGHTKGMTESPRMYLSPPFTAQISQLSVAASPDGSVEIAIRSWADAQVGSGLLDHVQIGSRDAIDDQLALARDRLWDQSVISGVMASFLFLCVAVLGAILYLAQRHHPEYLWLGLLCLSVTLRGAVETGYTLAAIPLLVLSELGAWASWFFLATTLQFILLFTGNRLKRVVRAVQLATLALPIAGALHLAQTFDYASIASEIVFLSLIVWMLFRAWRLGQREAGIMLFPFLLAASADSIDSILDFAARHEWIPASFSSHRHDLGPFQISTSTISYLVFLTSLVAVILYRFIRISQQEQRSSAEIEAARSVQAMLIPTQLPSNKIFALDSAYLPINGVGGDFFQALPLKDDSMLIVVGDVSGKGLQAAMNASSLVGALRNELSHDPATVLAHLNQVMLGASLGTGSGGPASFATCLCARIYPNGQMTIANAGHLNPYRDGREMELAPDLPLGILPNMHYEPSTFQLLPGDRLIFLSDGVVEAANAKGELFGFERTQQVSHEPARFIAQTAQKFGQTDDITVVSLYFVPA